MGACLSAQQKPAAFAQTLVILRHSERRDQVDPTYKDSDEGKAWPFDTSLTERGIQLARDVAKELAELHQKAKFNLIVSSPYRRCLQTAAEVAKALSLPVLIDQEVGEVWEEAMPQERPPHRAPAELQAMAEELGIRVRNPLLPEGGFKLVGRVPRKWPETVPDGHRRCLVRIEHYIHQSAKNRQNFIIVAHAPAVAAMMDIFQHGMLDVEKLEYCARVIASRKVTSSVTATELQHDKSVFAAQWDVESSGVACEINLTNTEEDHDKQCEEIEQLAVERFRSRTETDARLCDILLQEDES